jgi:hypothetical protein
MVIIPHQSASQTASPKRSLKTPVLCHSRVDNTNINIRKNKFLSTKIRKSDTRVSHLIKYSQFVGKIRDFQDSNLRNSGEGPIRIMFKGYH